MKIFDRVETLEDPIYQKIVTRMSPLNQYPLEA